MKKCGVIIYHADLLNIYKQSWIQKCLDSIRNQTFQDFTIYELCYSQTRHQWWTLNNYPHKYSHIPMSNHICGMNHILDKAFLDECDVVFNVNLDDAYAPERFELQLQAIEEGFDLISTNFQHITEIDGEDRFIRDMLFHDRNISHELDNDHNILCHSNICFTKKFWMENRYYDENSLGFEDKQLWQKAIANNCRIKILEPILCYYRLSENQTGRIYNAQGIKTK